MKHFLYLTASLLALLATSCKKDINPDQPAAPYLKNVTELRYLPDDSVTINYQYDREGILVLESSRGFSIKGFKDNPETAKITNGWAVFRLYTFNPFNQLVQFTQFSPSQDSQKSKSLTDSSIYEGNRLARKEIRRFSFNVDGDINIHFPMWVIRKSFTYDSKNRPATELDSVFITHDVPAEINLITRISPKFTHTNLTSYTYNDKNEVLQKTVVSNQNNALTYSSGRSAYLRSNLGKVYEGVTEYSYEHDAEGKMTKKMAMFTDAKSKAVFTSRFIYLHGI